MLIDLQLHSTYSDGYLTPTELVDFIYKQGIKVASLTDHNTVSGTGEFKIACKKKNIKPIVGLELYVKYKNHKMNILWYNFDYKKPSLHDLLRDSQIRRRRIVRRVLEKLAKKKFDIDPNIVDKYTHYVPINKIVDEIITKPKNLKIIQKELGAMSIREEDVIHEYLKNPKYGVIRNSFLSVERVLKLKKEIGGQIILCHPAKYNNIHKERWDDLKKKGLDGVELLSPHHSYGAIMYIQQLARELDLIETGGSDFHKFEGGGYAVQSSSQYFAIDSKMLRCIKKII